MDRRLNVNLGFTADTKAAKQAVLDLQRSLTSLVNDTAKSVPALGITTDIEKASRAAADLKIQLQMATDVDTGRLDLSKFNDSLKKSNKTLSQYRDMLYEFGPAGEKAFTDIAKAITLAEVPLRRTNALFDSLWTTMKNTARWQLTSSVLHGFMGALQHAYGYAQDLNESLNNIRIVTGYSVDKMSQFAEEANRAAKLLSTTTTEYTNASLIYYQQGLSPQEVKERTDLTIKMANVARVSAEAASDQLTAVWNNFADGTKSLEYYVDVMTALGAKTASSTDEIAGGLEKFAGIATTIGLSYEYATSALATLTSNTRQSEEVVGTALKTIFARIQGLNLGETLEDGVTLNKYSQAMKTVGIDILDQQKNLKSMDTLLDELGNKWNTISKAQQTALAQTVAGTRQYTQLVSLMDNWNKGDEDSFLSNLATARGSSGALQEQADIYAESWEAASERVSASAEAVYKALLNDEFFIDLTNVFANLLDGVDTFIDGLGGIKGVLLTIGSLATSVFAKQISGSIQNTIYSIKMLSSKAYQKELETKRTINESLIEGAQDLGTTGGSYRAEAYKGIARQQVAYMDNQQKMSEKEQLINQILMDRNRLLSEEIIKTGELLEEKEREVRLANKQIDTAIKEAYDKRPSSQKQANGKDLQKVKDTRKLYSDIQIASSAFDELESIIATIPKGLKNTDIEFQTLQKTIKNVITTLAGVDDLNTDEEFLRLAKILKINSDQAKNLWQDLEQSNTIETLSQKFVLLSQASEEASVKIKEELTKELGKIFGAGFDATTMLDTLNTTLSTFGIQLVSAESDIADFNTQIDRTAKSMEKLPPKTIEMTEAFTRAASAAMAVGQIVSTIQGIIDVFTDPEASVGDTIMAIVSGVGMLVPTVMSLGPAFSTAKVGAVLFGQAATAAGTAASLAMWQVTLIAAAIGAIVAGVVLLATQEEKSVKQIKAAEEQVEFLTESYEEANNAAEEFKATISNYDDAISALEELDTQTNEYVNALKKANDEARQLIETYKLWDEYTVENGQIIINKQALQNIESQLTANELNARALQQVGEIHLNSVLLASEQQKLRTQLGYKIDTGEVTKYTYGNTIVENPVMRFFKSSELEFLANQFNNLREQSEGLSPTLEVYKQSLKKIVSAQAESGYATSLGVDAFKSLDNILTDEALKAIEKYADSMNEAEAANRYYAAQIKKSDIAGKIGSRATTLATGASGEVNAQLQQSIIDVIAANITSAAMEEEIANAISNAEIENVKSNNKLKTFLKDTQYSETLTQVFGEDFTANKITNDEELAKWYGVMMGWGSYSDFGYAGGKGVGSLTNARTGQKYEDLNDEAMRMAIAQAVAKQAVLSKQKDETDTDIADWDAALTNLLTGTNNIAKIFGADFSQSILNALMGDKGVFNLGSALEELSPDEVKRLTGMDDDAIVSLFGLDQNTLKILGYKNTTAFAKALQTGLEAWTYNLDTTKIEEQAKNLQDVIEKAELGSQISKEQHQALLDLGIDTERYFTKMADGTYTLTAAADEFIRTLKGLSVQDFVTKIKDFRLAQAVAQNQIYQQNTYDKSLITTALTTVDIGNTVRDRDDLTDAEKIARIRAEYLRKIGADNLGLTEEENNLLNQTGWQTAEEFQKLADMMAYAARKDSELQSQFLSQSETLSELNQKTKELQKGIGAIDYDAYSEALIKVASQHAICTDKINDFNNALDSSDNVLIKTAQDALEASILVGEGATAYGLNAELLQTHADLLKETHKALTVQDAAKLAIENARVNKGVEDLVDNWEEWNTILTTGNKVSEEYAETINSLQNVIRNLTGVNEDFAVSTEFITKNLKDLEKAALGDEKAISMLGLALSKDYFDNLELIYSDEYAREAAHNIATSEARSIKDIYERENQYWNIYAETANDPEKIAQHFENAKQIIANGLFTLQELINNNEIDIGDSIGGNLGETWIQALNDMALATHMTQKEMNSLLSSMGMSADVFVKDVTTETSVPNYKLEGSIGTDGTFSMNAVPSGYTPIETTTQIATIGNPATVKYVGNEKINTIKPKDSGKSKTNNLGEIERYKAINDQLDELADAYEDVAKAADRLYGNDRLTQISKQNHLLRDEITLLEEKRKKAEETYLPNDQTAVDNALSVFNLTDGNGNPLKFRYDNGIITNYRDILEQVRQAAEGDETKSEQFQILLDAIEQYDQTRELIRDINNEIRDTNNLIQDNNYIKLTEKLNYDLEITNNELQELDYYLSKAEGDFYKMAEAAGYMVGDDGKSGQRGYYEEILDRQQTQVEALKTAYAAGDISEADYVEGLKEAKDAIYEQLEALTGLDKQMLEYYGNTLAAAGEEIGKYTEKMDNLNGVLDHYSSLLKLIGKEKNYDMMAEVLKGSVDVLSDSLDVATKEYEFYSTEAQNKEKAYNDAVDAGAKQSVLDLLKKEWEAAEQAQADAQDRMLAKTEQWAEAQKAVIENAMEKAAAALEDALVGKHYSFDFLNEQIDQAVSTQEEYLTTTNKIYETTKLMRTAQQAVDAATNATTKQKLKNFITETKQLQDQTDLSKYELEIQQAKYDLLLAEISLQDAQNAKSMVRLKRDSEGNFGYVYTADENQVADAQQNLEDAENNLYNIALRGAEDYTTKQIELKQEMQEKLKELTMQFRNGEIQDEEEYNARIASMQEFYISEMEKNARLYGVAIDTDNRVIADSWSTTFADLTTDTSQWTTSVTTYLNESAIQLENWEKVMATVTDIVTGDCKNLADSIGKVTDASQDLRNTLLGSEGSTGVFDEVKSQLDSVSKITQAYAEQRLTIQGLISDYENYVKTVKGDITTAITDGENPPPATGKPDTNPPASELKKGSKATLATSATTWASGATIASYAKGATFEILAIEGDRVLLGNPSYNPEGGVTGWIKKTDLAGFGSGGYTGEWGPSGKLAMLHEKELILNQMDTFNMLTAVDTLHKILEIIDLQSLNASLGGMLSVPGYRDTGSGMLEQNVKIEATFPNVSDHFEIEEAFNTLINQASQYANRK